MDWSAQRCRARRARRFLERTEPPGGQGAAAQPPTRPAVREPQRGPSPQTWPKGTTGRAPGSTADRLVNLEAASDLGRGRPAGPPADLPRYTTDWWSVGRSPPFPQSAHKRLIDRSIKAQEPRRRSRTSQADTQPPSGGQERLAHSTSSTLASSARLACHARKSRSTVICAASPL
jgi:hypothetical protein